MWSSLDEVKESYRASTTWDDWILATYRDRIDFASFLKDNTRSVSPDEKVLILTGWDNKTGKRASEFSLDNPKSPRNAILRAIKSNTQGQHYNRQTAFFLFAKICVLLIATSSGFVISSILGAHLGLSGGWKSAIDILSFTACFISNVISFRISVPGVMRKLFEWDKYGWHFWAKKEITLYKAADRKVKIGYLETNDDNPVSAPKDQTEQTKTYTEYLEDDQDLGWKSKGALLVQFGLVTVAGLAILAQTVEKAANGMTEIFPFIAGVGVVGPLAWVMGCAAFVCMLGQLTFSVIRFLRQKDKTKELRAVFRSVDPEKKNYGEVYVYNFLMGTVALGLAAFVALGAYGTSDVQAASFMNLVHASKNTVGQLAICLCSVAGKAVFTARGLANLIGIMRAAVGAVWNWGTGHGYRSPFNKREGEDVVSTPGYVAIGLYAMARATTAVPTPEPGEDSILDSGNISSRFFAWSTVGGSFIRNVQEPLDKLKPKDTEHVHATAPKHQYKYEIPKPRSAKIV